MAIRIDSIESVLSDDGFRWALKAKGLYGQGTYFTAATGLNGHGLYATANDFEMEMARDGYRVAETSALGVTIELIAPDRFSVPSRCDATAVVKRVVTALVTIGWGPEVVDDRDAISGRRVVRAFVRDNRAHRPSLGRPAWNR